MLNEVLQKLVSHALEVALWGLSLALLAALQPTENYLAQYVQKLTPVATVRVIVVLLAAVSAAFAYALWSRPKFKVSQIDGGVWLDTKTGVRYCPNCRSKKILAPLNDDDDLDWACSVIGCEKRYRKKLHYPGEGTRER